MKVGIMSFAHMHAHSYATSLQQLENTELTAIFDDDPERGRTIANEFQTTYYSDQTEFLKMDMDAVVICSENNHHKDMVINAARAKKHILCEKPIATTLEDAQKMIQVCQEEDVQLQIAFPVRFSTGMQQLKQMVDNGELGEIVACRSVNRGQNPGGWFIDAEQSGGGAVLDHTVHMADIMRWLMNAEVTDVTAIVNSFFHQIDIDDAGLLTLEFDNGVIASHDASWSRFPEYPAFGDAAIEVIGTKQSVTADTFGEHFTQYGKDKAISHVHFGYDMDLCLIQDFVENTAKGKQPSITGHDGLKALEIALAAYESSRQNDTVSL